MIFTDILRYVFTDIPLSAIMKEKGLCMRQRERTRVTVDFPQDEHKRLKAVAALMGVSMQQYIIGCVEEKLYSENVPNAKTRKVFKETDEAKNLNACENVNDLIKKLGK